MFTACAPESRKAALDVRLETRPFLEVVAGALGLPRLRLVATGGDAYESERDQWNAGNNLLAFAPGVVISYNRRARSGLNRPARARRGLLA